MSDGDRVVLTVPSKGEYARTVRLAAAELASRAGMDIDGVDDFRLAVEEAFVFGSEHVDGESLEFAFTIREGAIELVVGPLDEGCTSEEAPDRGERYARFILESICDECEIGCVDGIYRVRIVKTAGE